MASTNFTIDFSAAPPGTSVVGFRLRDALSEPFVLEVGLRTQAGQRIAPDEALGERFHLEIRRGAVLEEPQVYNGIVAALELLHESEEVSLWRVVVVPKLDNLRRSFHSRIFTGATVPEIVEAVLLDEGLSPPDFRFSLRGNYPTLEHVCMFRESSLAFIDRLLEREGITYFFEHDGDRHVLVLVDDLGEHAESRGAVPMIPYVDDDATSREGFFEFSYEHRALPGEVRVTDYDYLRPSTAISADAAIQRRKTGVVVEHAEFVPLPDEERRYADLRSEEILCREQWFQGWGRVLGLRAGHTFPVQGHDLRRLDDEYLAVEIEAEGFALEVGGGGGEAAWLAGLYGLEGKRGVVVNVSAIPKNVQFRPARTTPWPRVHGIVDGVVDGMAKSDYAQIDAQGRYKVRLRFDESDLLDGQASTWIRMLQPHGGSDEGWHFPLRKGTEVQVAFLGGDPDRPMIVGAAHNAIEKSKVRNANYTQNVIHTGGDNTITAEDLAGGMYWTNFTPTDASTLHLGAGANQMELRTDGQGHLHIGLNLDVDVFGQKLETVKETLRETYVGYQSLTVTKAVTRLMKTSLEQKVLGKVKEHVTETLTEKVTKDVTETYGNGQSTTVTGGVKQKLGGKLEQTVNGGLMKEEMGEIRLRIVTGTYKNTVTAHAEEEFGPTFRLVGGDYTEHVKGSYTLRAPELKVICTEQTTTDSALNALQFVVKHLNKVTEWAAGIKLSGTGVSIGLTGVSIEQNTLALGLTGISRQAIGASMDIDGIQLRKHGMVCRKKGLEVVATGIFIIL